MEDIGTRCQKLSQKEKFHPDPRIRNACDQLRSVFIPASVRLPSLRRTALVGASPCSGVFSPLAPVDNGPCSFSEVYTIMTVMVEIMTEEGGFSWQHRR